MIKSNIFQVERPWGNFRQFTKNEISTIKIIKVMPNEALSLQSHKNRREFWHVIKGSGVVEINNSKISANIGDEFEIDLEEKHRLTAGENGIEILEIATGDFDEEDIIHFEDKYGRI